MRAPKRKPPEFAVCVRKDAYAASFELRKLYRIVEDSDAEAERLVRVVDESGEDYLYPATLFRRIDLPDAVRRALHKTS